MALSLRPLIVFMFFIGQAVECSSDRLEEDEPLPDYYAVLKLTQEASLQDIRRSFRRLALKYHPDRNSDPEAEAIFKDLSEAYAVLNDPEKKREYDEVLMEEREATGGQPTEAAAPPPAAKSPPVSRPAPPSADQQSPPPPADGSEQPREEQQTTADGQATPEKTADEAKASSVFDEMDEEVLLQMLTFLANYEFTITKRVSSTNWFQEESFDNAYHRTRRSTDSFPTWEEPTWSAGPAWEEPTWSAGPAWKEPTWSAGPRSSSFNCRTTVHWEGQVKVTSTFC